MSKINWASQEKVKNSDRIYWPVSLQYFVNSFPPLIEKPSLHVITIMNLISMFGNQRLFSFKSFKSYLLIKMIIKMILLLG